MGRERVLVIDDEADFAAFVRRVVHKLDFEVEVTSNPREFKEIYRRFDPTTTVLDIVMPDTDGIELIQWLAWMRCKARLVIVSGFDPNYVEVAQKLGSAAGLASIVKLKKPISTADLENALS